MAKYKIEEKPGFAVAGIGMESKSSNADFVGLAAEKQAFEQKVISDGTIDTSKKAVENHYFFTVNGPYDGRMIYYIGVQTSQDVPNITRTIPFPKGTYLIISDSSESPKELKNDLTNTAFGHALKEVKDYAYVGGPDAIIEMGAADGKHIGEI